MKEQKHEIPQQYSLPESQIQPPLLDSSSTSLRLTSDIPTQLSLDMESKSSHIGLPTMQSPTSVTTKPYRQISSSSSINTEPHIVLKAFADGLAKFTIWECLVCEESGINLPGKYRDLTFICDSCLRERDSKNWSGIYKYSQANDMSPGDIPRQLSVCGRLTPIEAMILALVHPIIRVYKVKGFGQFKGGKVHVVNFPQSPTEIFHVIPRLPHEVPIIVLKVKGPNGTTPQVSIKDFEINVYRMHTWIQYLCKHNC